MVSLAATTFYTIVCWLTGFLAGTAFWEIGSLSGTTGDLVITLLLQLLGNFAYTSLFFLIAILFKKTGGSIAVGIIGPLVLSMIISLADTLTHKNPLILLTTGWITVCIKLQQTLWLRI